MNAILNNFMTSVVGSFPREKSLIKSFKEKSPTLHNDIENAVKNTIYRQEEIGLDIITDGEQGRTSFVNFIGDKIDTITPTHINKLYPNATDILKLNKTFLPYIRAVPDMYLGNSYNLTGDEVERIKRYTTKPIKITLPSPYLLMWETWHNQITKPYYNKPEDLGEVYVEIIRNEILRLKNEGVHTIQIDEPMLGNLLESIDGKPDRYRKIFGIINGQKYRGFKEELTLCKDMMNETIRGINGINIEMHICHWPNHDSPNHGIGVEKLLPDLFDIKVDGLVLEYATNGSGDPIQLVKDYPNHLGISLGVIDVQNKEVEKPSDIVKKVLPITNYVDPEKIKLVPDCGFSPGLTHPFPINTSYDKVHAMVKASHILRNSV